MSNFTFTICRKGKELCDSPSDGAVGFVHRQVASRMLAAALPVLAAIDALSHASVLLYKGTAVVLTLGYLARHFESFSCAAMQTHACKAAFLSVGIFGLPVMALVAPKATYAFVVALDPPPWHAWISSLQGDQIERSEEHFDTRLVQFLLNDYVGGGKGGDVAPAVDFLKHYVGEYCKHFPQDVDAKKIGESLGNYIYEGNASRPLTEAAEEIWQTLERTGYIAIGGGIYDGDGGGHALFYEFILDKGQVTFQVTNSGDGLQYHPHTAMGDAYRTIVFSGANLQDLQKSLFLEFLLSFMRKRPALASLKGIVQDPLPRLSTVADVYQVLLYYWPGKGPFVSKNPGIGQRGASCSLQALMKWVKGVCDRNNHPWLTLWIKLSAFSDYLDNEPKLSSQFIADALRKISTHIDKMDKQHEMPTPLFNAWKEIFQRAIEKKSEALTLEASKRASEALSARKNGLGTEYYKDVRLVLPRCDYKKNPEPASYVYPHAFPGEKAPLSELSKLVSWNLNRLHLFDGMSYRLNMARLLPFCLEWDASLIKNEKKLEDLGALLELFFHTKAPAPSLHVPDSFCVDLLNVWMGIYLVAKRQGNISSEVLFEWMEGASLLIESYTPEFRFDSPQSRQKWTALEELITTEKQCLRDALGPLYQPPENYWTIWDKNFNTWHPFASKVPIKKLSELPAMAVFARKILQSVASVPDNNNATQSFSAKEIEKLRDDSNICPLEVRKAIKAFGCALSPTVPYYDRLREGLAALFGVFDRFLRKDKEGDHNYESLPLYPRNNDRSEGDFYIGTRADATTRHEELAKTPECILPKTEASLKSVQDLNRRIKSVDESKWFPFMTFLESQELQIFVQKEIATRLTEMLVFFSKCLHKLSLPTYQAIFEHLLFSKKGGALLEELFKQDSRSIALLFQFFEKGYEELLKQAPARQTGAAALLHSHMRLVQLSCFYEHPLQGQHVEQLLKSWDQLICAGEKNPILGKALGLAVFAALPSLEFIYPKLLSYPAFLPLLTTTCLLESVQGDYTETPYSHLQIHYGLVSFKALLTRCSQEEAHRLWQTSAERIFGKKESARCLWDPVKDRLQLATLQIDLKARYIERGAESCMRLIPETYRDNDFKHLFGNRNFFASVWTEEKIETYAFFWGKSSYELRVDLSYGKSSIYKEFGGQWYSYNDYNSLEAHFKACLLWSGQETTLVENKETGEILASGTSEALYRHSKGERLNEQLVQFDNRTFLQQLFERLQICVRVWADPAAKRIQRIELPSLQLQFCRQVEMGQEKMYSVNFPGFFIAEEQQVAFLKGFKVALVLENAAGRKKVITPLCCLDEPPYQPYEEPSIITRNEREEAGYNRPYFTFDLEHAGAIPLFSPRLCHQAATIWLIFLYLHIREYRAALDLITQTRVTSQLSLTPLTELIYDFRSSPSSDTHPHAVALRLRLFAWRERWGKERWWSSLVSYTKLDRTLYENLRNAMGPFAIPSKELPNHEIQKSVQALSSLSFPRLLEKGNLSTDLPKKLREKIVEAAQNGPQPALSLTVVGEDFILNFLSHHQTICYGTEEEKKRLKLTLYFTCTDPSRLIATLSRILLHEEKEKKKTDFQALFKLQKQEFDQRFQPYLDTIENSPLLFPALREDIIWEKRGEKSAVIPREAKVLDTFLPLPPLFAIALRPLPFKELEQGLTVYRPVDVTADISATRQLSEWAEKEAALANEEVLQTPFKRLQSGALRLEQEYLNVGATEEVLSSDPNVREGALQRIASEIKTRKGALQAQEQKILALANNLHNQRQLYLEMGRELRAPLDIETLLIALGRKELSAIRNANTSLSNTEIEELMQEVAEYAASRGDYQQLVRARHCLSVAPEEYLSHARAVRCYDPIKAPELLVFEIFSDLVLRKEQIDALRDLTPGTLFEARTGFGKSKALLPLWLLLKGHAILISPATLFDAQEQYLQNLLQKAYHFFAVTIEFTRNSLATKKDIDFIREEMQRAQALRRPVFMSDQTAHSLFILKLKELLQLEGDNKGGLEALLFLRHHVKGIPVFIEEPHKVLDDRQEFNYSIGRPTPIAPERLQFEVDLYKHFFSLIEGHYQVECLPSEGNLPQLTEEIYREKVLAQLLDRMMQASPKEREYLLGKLALDEQQKFERDLKDPAVRLLHDQLHHYLPKTLQRHCNEHYELKDPDRERIAIPLEDARNPHQNNEFVTIDQMLNFTIQANLKIPFSKAYIHVYLQTLGQRATEEAEQKKISLKKTEAYCQFLLLMQGLLPPPSGLLTMTPEEFVRVHAHLNENIEAKLQLILFEELPKVLHFNEKVSSTPHLLVQCFDQLVGASGTLAMQHFPHTCTVTVDERAIAKTVVAVLKKKDPVVELQEMKPDQILPTLQKHFPKASVIIEVGAMLRHYPQLEQMAQEILQLYPSFQGVATFDPAGHPIVMTKNSTLWMPIESVVIPRSQLFWFYGQKDITGRDEKMEKEAMALVLVNQYTTLSHLIQGIGRMRGILNGQRVTIVIDHESAFHIKKARNKSEQEELTLLDLFGYCAQEEGRNNGLANFRSLSLQLDALVEQCLLAGILTSSVPPMTLLRKIRPHIVESTEDAPLSRPSFTLLPVDLKQALKCVMDAFNQKIEKIQQLKDPGIPKIDLATMQKKAGLVQSKMDYPQQVYLNHTLDSSQIVETTSEQMVTGQKMTTTTVQTETVDASETTTLSAQFAWNNFLQGKEALPHSPEITPHPLSKVLSHPQLQKYLPLFEGTLLHISQNALCTFTCDDVSKPGWVNGYMKPLHYIALLLDGTYVLIDSEEAAQILKGYFTVQFLWLVNHGRIDHGQAPIPPELAQVEIHAKLFNKDLEFSKEQQPYLKISLEHPLLQELRREITIHK